MPDHAPATDSRLSRLSRRSRNIPGDERAVSEVLGAILVLATVTLVLMIGFYGFTQNETRVRERVVTLQAQSAAQRVAATAVDAAVFAEAHGANATYQRTLELPDSFEGSAYRVALEASPPRVRVLVPASGETVTAPLFGADAATSVTLCDTDLIGGRMTVRHDDRQTPGSACIYLESAT